MSQQQTKDQHKYYRDLVEIPVYNLSYQLTRYIIHSTERTPKNKQHIAERVHNNVMIFCEDIYKAYKEQDKQKKLDMALSLRGKLGIIAFSSKLMFDTRIIQKNHQEELIKFTGQIGIELDKWVNYLKSRV